MIRYLDNNGAQTLQCHLNQLLYIMINGTFNKTITIMITANELKTKGVSIIERSLKDQLEDVITVRGRPKYVVMSVEQYDRLRLCELEVAYLETKKDIESGDYVVESVEEHLKRLS